MYDFLKSIHVICAAVTIIGFAIRGAMKLKGSERLQKKWLKIVPHINDTILLATAIALAVMLGLSPLQHLWLAAKIIVLIIYIALGMLLMKRDFGFPTQLMLYLGALVSVIYIAAVAVSKSAVPF